MRGPLKASRLFREGVVLSAAFDGAGPGMSMLFEIGIRTRGEHVELWAWNEDLDDAERFARINGPYAWPAAVRRLARARGYGGGSEILISDIEVQGAIGAVAELYRLAWGSATSKALAVHLSTCDENELLSLSVDLGRLDGARARSVLVPIRKRMSAHGIKEDFATLIRSVEQPDWRALRRLRAAIRLRSKHSKRGDADA